MFSENLLPIGNQSFEDLRINKSIYVDKTKYIYELSKGKFYFLSRPRRFGKSLLLSTFEALFKGKKELFEGLWISTSDYDWKEHPVLHIDMSMPTSNTLKGLEENLKQQIYRTAKHYDINIDRNSSLDFHIEEFVREASFRYNKVVILIDEYDNPIHSLMYLDEEELKKIQVFLRNFYSILKKLSPHIRFAFLTGITQFSKLSVFSGLNNLKDISLNKNYSSLLGYTQSELEEYFSIFIDSISFEKNLKKSFLLDDIRNWYNGYQFSYENTEKVYNPFSVLLFFGNEGDFRNYWFTTGNTTFFYYFLKNHNFDIEKVEGMSLNKNDIGTDEALNPRINSLMFQAGYLTISTYNPTNGNLTLNFPNYEVRSSFFRHYLKCETNNDSSVFEEISSNAVEALKSGNVDNFIAAVKNYFLQIPYPLNIKNQEKYYHVLFYVFVAMLGPDINHGVEENTSLGRMDLYIETQKHIFLCELKLKTSSKKALKQIHERRYFEKFLPSGKKLILLGISFDDKLRNISDYIFEEK